MEALKIETRTERTNFFKKPPVVVLFALGGVVVAMTKFSKK